jgi:hypothetical protein
VPQSTSEAVECDGRHIGSRGPLATALADHWCSCALEAQTDLSIPERLSHIQVVCGGTVEGFLMASIYDAFADSCAALATKAKRESDKVRLLQLADQWRTVTADRQGPGKKPPAPVATAPASDIVNRVPLRARPVRERSVCGADMQKSAFEEIKELKAQLERKTERAKAEALDKASEAIGVLRGLGIDNDTILKELGFRGRTNAQESREGKPPKEEMCPICNFRTDPPHDGRSHRGQTKKRPLTAEELEQKSLTKV